MKASHYPLVVCRDHELAPAFIVCTHVLAGTPIAHLVEPADEPGEALCAACHARELTPADIDQLKLICVHCFRGEVSRAG